MCTFLKISCSIGEQIGEGDKGGIGVRGKAGL
jgi:hypothetical protein